MKDSGKPTADTPQQTPWHALPLEDVLQRLQTAATGLTLAEAADRLQRFGENMLQTVKGPNLALLAFRQIVNPLILMLLAAALVSMGTGHFVDAWVIVAVVILNTIVGVAQEWRAEQALEALRRLSAPHARVLRDGESTIIPAAEVVIGDVLLLEGGDRMPADARLLESSDLQVDESALTGESQPVDKTPAELPLRLPLADRTNMLWMSTPVTTGRGRAVVVATGMQTVMGEIAREVRTTERSETPLQHRIGRLGTLLGVAAVGFSGLIFLLGLLRGIPVYEMLLFAVAAAVSAIPEGLPAVISVVLALGVQRMARRHAIIRRLPAVETLGSTTVICSDKTGTITRNEMTVTRIWAGGRLYRVTGEGFSPEGDIFPEGEEKSVAAELTAHPALIALLRIGSLANDATLAHTDSGWQVHGDPTEAALLAVARKGGEAPEQLQRDNPRIDDIPFSNKFRYMAVLCRPEGADRSVVYVKGAAERLLEMSNHLLEDGRRVPLTDEHRRMLLTVNDELAAQGLRVLAGAYSEFPATMTELERSQVEQGLTFAGFWGMQDPPRPEAIRAIAAAQQAGIRVKMITGDHAVTAAVIARQAGIASHGEVAVTGEELDEMSEEELRRRMPKIAVFARVSPPHKLRIVNALRKEGEVVAMTGDGVNDAPALKQADIGIAMGITGTEVAKEAADMVLTDDNFATIVNAIQEGRVIFGNLRKVVFFLTATNLDEIITITVALVIGLPLPLTAIMILWVNLVTDGVLTTPLGVEPQHQDVLQQPPRPTTAGLIDRSVLIRMAFLSPLMALGTLLLFTYELGNRDFAHAQTVAFCTLVAFQWFQAFNARSHRSSLFTIGIFTNRWLIASIFIAVLLQLLVIYWPPAQLVFSTAPLSLADWGRILAVASSVFVMDELRKLVLRLLHRK
ncbi:MAG: cation-translocating P-type ATPase [Armatimonadota bacterium]